MWSISENSHGRTQNFFVKEGKRQKTPHKKIKGPSHGGKDPSPIEKGPSEE